MNRTPGEVAIILQRIAEAIEYAMCNPDDADPMGIAVESYSLSIGELPCHFTGHYCSVLNCRTCGTWAKYSGLCRSY